MSDLGVRWFSRRIAGSETIMDAPSTTGCQGRLERFSRQHRLGLLTVLFTDIVGSTGLKQELGDHVAVGLIQQHHALVREVLAAFEQAEEIETAGDSFLLAFARPSEATRFALVLLKRLRAWASQTGHLVFDRVGIHVGEMVIEERAEGLKAKELYGMQVDTCARVMSLAGANQILLTRFAFDSARQMLKGQDVAGVGELRWLNHGPYLFKGLEEPLEVCEVRAGGTEPVTPPPSTEKAQRYAAPGQEPVLGWRPAVGQVVPGTQWSLEEKLGEGGFGEVWLARHDRLKEERVFKFCFRADRVRALKREMTLFRVLKQRTGEHPNLVRLLEVYLEQSPYYLEEEYVVGRDLRSWCAAQGGVDQVPLTMRLEIVAQVADGLAAAHGAGIVHRDIKPGNILIGDFSVALGDEKKGQTPAKESRGTDGAAGSCAPSPTKNETPKLLAKLTDFGIGQVVSAEYLAGVTAAGFTGTILRSTSTSQSGTHMYMAPEVLAGRPTSPQSDLYSLGVVLYQLLVGDFTRPVTTDWGRDVGDPVLKEDLQRCFAGSPAERFGSAAELAKSLRTLDERRATRAAVTKEAFERGAAKVASLAVLPFVNMSADPENEFLSDGIAEDLLTALTRVPGLRVPGRTSCFVFKGKTDDLRKIGQMLNVETVLEGSVRKAGQRLRITAQLINVADGFHLWSERYDREMADVFAIQDEITQAIVTALKAKLVMDQPSILVKPYTSNIQAYELCLHARYHAYKWTPSGVGTAIRLYEQALQLDPDYPPAHVGVSEALRMVCYFGGLPPTQAIPKAKAAARRALQLDDALAEAHLMMGNLLYFHDWDWSGAEREFQRSLELSPRSPETHLWYGFFLWARLRNEEALTETQKALELDPFSPNANWWHTWVLFSLRRHGEAMAVGQKLVSMDATFWGGHWIVAVAEMARGRWSEGLEHYARAADLEGGPVTLGTLCWFYARGGRTSEAEQLFRKLEEMATHRYVPSVWLAWCCDAVGDQDRARACILEALQVRDPALVHLRGFSRWFPELLVHCRDLLDEHGL